MPAAPPPALLTPRREALAPFLPDLLRIEALSFPAPWGEAELREEADHPMGLLSLLALPPLDDPAVPPRVLAFCCARRLYDELHILQIATDPAERRRGHAERLLRHALDEGAARGCEQALLEVRGGNRAALRLYQDRLGFTVIGRRRGYYSDGEDAVVLRRALVPGGVAVLT